MRDVPHDATTSSAATSSTRKLQKSQTAKLIRMGSGARFGLGETPADVAMLKEQLVEMRDKLKAKARALNVEAKKSRAYQNLIKAMATETAREPDVESVAAVLAVKAFAGKVLTAKEKVALRKAMESQESDEEKEEEEREDGWDEEEEEEEEVEEIQGVEDVLAAIAAKAASGRILTEDEKALLRAADKADNGEELSEVEARLLADVKDGLFTFYGSDAGSASEDAGTETGDGEEDGDGGATRTAGYFGKADDESAPPEGANPFLSPPPKNDSAAMIEEAKRQVEEQRERRAQDEELRALTTKAAAGKMLTEDEKETLQKAAEAERAAVTLQAAERGRQARSHVQSMRDGGFIDITPPSTPQSQPPSSSSSLSQQPPPPATPRNPFDGAYVAALDGKLLTDEQTNILAAVADAEAGKLLTDEQMTLLQWAKTDFGEKPGTESTTPALAALAEMDLPPSIEVIVAKAESGRMLTEAEKAALKAADAEDDSDDVGAEERAAVTLQAAERGRQARSHVQNMRDLIS